MAEPLPSPAWNEKVLTALRKFTSLPGALPGVIDQPFLPLQPPYQPTGDPHAMAFLPLWRETEQFNHENTNWKAYLELLEAIMPRIRYAAMLLKEGNPDKYKEAIRRYLEYSSKDNKYPAIGKEMMELHNCFSTLRICANISSGGVALCSNTNHLVIMGFGAANVTLFTIPGGKLIKDVGRAGMTLVSAGDKMIMDNVAESGEWYTLELCVPTKET